MYSRGPNGELIVHERDEGDEGNVEAFEVEALLPSSSSSSSQSHRCEQVTTMSTNALSWLFGAERGELSRAQVLMERLAYRPGVAVGGGYYLMTSTLPKMNEPYWGLVCAASSVTYTIVSDLLRLQGYRANPKANASWWGAFRYVISDLTAVGVVGLTTGYTLWAVVPPSVQLDPVWVATGVGLAGLTVFDATKKALEWGVGYTPASEGAIGIDNQLQGFSNLYPNVMEPVFGYALLRGTLLGFGKYNTVNNPYFPILVVPIHEALKAFNHWMRIPQPFANFNPGHPSAARSPVEDFFPRNTESGLNGNPRDAFNAIGYYLLRTILVMAVSVGVIEAMYAAEGHRNPEELPDSKRDLNTTLLSALILIIEPIMDVIIKLAAGLLVCTTNMASVCCVSMFQRRQAMMNARAAQNAAQIQDESGRDLEQIKPPH